jgi:hypothetical protein
MHDDVDVTTEQESSVDRTKPFLLASIAMTVALFYVPFGHQVGFPLVLVSTVATRWVTR